MIEIFESRALHFTRCSQRERMAAAAMINMEARQIRVALAEMYDREVYRLPAPRAGSMHDSDRRPAVPAAGS